MFETLNLTVRRYLCLAIPASVLMIVAAHETVVVLFKRGAFDYLLKPFDIEELTATKIRALFQRRKGRDLFDLWLAFEHGTATLDDVVECFEPYRPDGWTGDRALANLDAKLNDTTFLDDLDALVAGQPEGYDHESARRVAEEVIEAAERRRQRLRKARSALKEIQDLADETGMDL